MIIEKLYIGSFGGLREFTLELDSGINIIEGPDEAGKTTAAAFCAYVLYGFERDKNEKTLRLNRESSTASGYLQISADGQRYRIERESSQNDRDRVKIIELIGNSVCMKGRVPGEVFLGVPAELYFHTTHVTQTQGAEIDGTGVYDALENILFSGNEAVSIQKALKKLDEARVTLLHKNEKGGRIAELKKERENLDARLYRASESNKKIIITESSLTDTRENLAVNKKKLAELVLRLKFYDTDTAIRNFDKMHTLRAEEAKLETEHKNSIAENTYQGFLPDNRYTAKLKEIDAEIGHLRGEAHSINEERARHVASEPDKARSEALINEIAGLGGKYEILNHAEVNRRKAKYRCLAGFTAAVIAVCLLISAVVLFFKGSSPAFTVITAAAMIPFAAAAVVFYKSAVTPRRDNEDVLRRLGGDDTSSLERLLDESLTREIKLNLYYSRLDEIDKKRDISASKLAAKQSELDVLLRKWGRDTVDKAVNDVETMYTGLQRQLSEIENYRNAIRYIDGQLVGYDEAAIRESYTGMSEDYEKLNCDPVKDRQNISALRTHCDFMRKQNASLLERCHLLENQLTELRAVTEKPAQLADHIYALGEEIASAEKRHYAYVLAGNTLTAAAENLRSNITPNLSTQSGKLLETVTDGRYGEIGIGKDMSLVYTVRDRGADTRSVEYMSAGTKDLAYISLRLALMNFIYRASVPPVILDESFARLDDRRLELTFRLIAEYAQKGYQIILLTTQKRDALIMEGIARYRHILLGQ